MSGRTWVVSFLTSILVACGATLSHIISNRDQSYTAEPKRIFVVSGIGNEFSEDFAEPFQAKLTAIAKDCGAELQVSRLTPLELNENIHTERMKSFNPDSLIVITRTGGTVNQYGRRVNADYDVKFVDVGSNKAVWRASVRVYRGSSLVPFKDQAEALAINLTNKLKEDQILRSCQVVQPQK